VITGSEKSMEGEKGMPRLLDVAEAQQRLLESFNPLLPISLPLIQSAGRILAEDVRSQVDLPPFANSSMDGFAVRTAEAGSASQQKPVVLKVVADIPAGTVSSISIQAGQAARIMTGAPLPDGSDAVVPVEHTDFNERQPGTPPPAFVQILKPAQIGENTRPRGQDIHVGEVVMRRGFHLRPQDIGFLAMLGIPELKVYESPRVAIFSSGDELLPVNAPLSPGKIHDANSYTLITLVEKYGGSFVNLGIVPDTAEAVRDCLERAVAEKVDLILSSAGVSVGAFDFVRSVVEEQGRLEFWRVNMRPGKPLAFGYYRGVPFIGLPGNPVSAFVGFEVFVRPALLKLAGLSHWEKPVRRVILQEPVESDGRQSYLRGIVQYQNGTWQAHLTGHQGSGNLHSLVQANALLLIPSGVKSLPIGAEVDAWLLDNS
jgi:molybdopterin molybdotransferase